MELNYPIRPSGKSINKLSGHIFVSNKIMYQLFVVVCTLSSFLPCMSFYHHPFILKAKSGSSMIQKSSMPISLSTTSKACRFCTTSSSSFLINRHCRNVVTWELAAAANTIKDNNKDIKEDKISFSSVDQKKNQENEKTNRILYDCLVIGGGISGSTLAHNLYVSGIQNIVLAESRDYLGGNVKSHQTDDGYIWEEGPNSFAAQPSIVRIAHELKIDDQLVFADEALPPWVYHNDKLHPLPKGKGGKGMKGQLELIFGPNGVLSFALKGQLLSWPGKIRAGIGAFIGHASPLPDDEKEETIQEFIIRTLGEEVFLRCIDPFISGVYAGNPATLGMKAALPKIARIEDISYGIVWNKFGALFYGGIKRQIELTKERKASPPDPEWIDFEPGNPGSFRYGLSTLPNAIYNELNNNDDDTKNHKIQLSWKVIKVTKDNNEFITIFDTPNGIQTIRSKVVVSTIPAHALHGIFTSIGSEIDDICTTVREDINRIGIYHPPVAAVTVAYPKSSFKDIELPNEFGNLQNLPGFGSLNPRTEKVRTLGTLWSSSLFPNRCPDNYNLLLNYIGGSRDISIANMTNEEIIQEVDNGCRKVLLKPDAPRPKVIGIKVWPKAIPQYELGHKKLMLKIETLEKKTPGLYVCGNYRTGVAFPDCVTFGYEHAKAVKEYLQSVPISDDAEEGSSSKDIVVAPVKSKDSATIKEPPALIVVEAENKEQDHDNVPNYEELSVAAMSNTSSVSDTTKEGEEEEPVAKATVATMSNTSSISETTKEGEKDESVVKATKQLTVQS